MAQITSSDPLVQWSLVPLVPAEFDERINDIDIQYEALENAIFNGSLSFRSASSSKIVADILSFPGGRITITGSDLLSGRPTMKSVSWSSGDDGFKASGKFRYSDDGDFFGGTIKSATLKVDGEAITMSGSVAIQANGNFSGTVTRLAWNEDGARFAAGGSFSVVHNEAGNTTTVDGTVTRFSVLLDGAVLLSLENISIPLSALDGVDTVGELLTLLPAQLPGNDTISLVDETGALVGGGAGNDTYIVNSPTWTVDENPGEGTDTVRIAYIGPGTVALADYPNVENLEVAGKGAFSLVGGDGANVLKGNASANTLDGGAGADTLAGGKGNDTYVVDDGADVVAEGKAAGTDTVQSSVTRTLGANQEHLTLIGASAIDGTGNGLGNVLTGNSAANVLTGLGGNDTYFIGAGDTVVEAAKGGTDTVHSSVDYTLGANQERLVLAGTGLAGTGNAQANRITGGDGDDTIDGGLGADLMRGGLGDDRYTVDNAGDVVTELAAQGEDSVLASVSHTLRANVEDLTLTGNALKGTGNAGDNEIAGNALANTLDGKAGADTLTGGDGNDRFVLSKQDGTFDTIADFTSGSDKLAFDNDAFTRLGAKGALSAARFVAGEGVTAAATTAQRLIYDEATGDLYYDANGSAAGGGPVKIALLAGAPTLLATDILIIE
jgi:Ca2+-binding RTX toxin-like protein